MNVIIEIMDTKKFDYKALGPAARSMRIHREVPQTEFADAIGISKSKLCRFESGRYLPPPLVKKIITTLGYTSQDELLVAAVELPSHAPYTHVTAPKEASRAPTMIAKSADDALIEEGVLATNVPGQDLWSAWVNSVPVTSKGRG